ncbi:MULTISPECIES: SDR family NAD(P)-dependent oxidoreductase [Rhizobium]|uniref:SDR family NAD(P)-dependent oxidoreductase n=1 Tax=Rhizobium TaxID=379 RepID=UPI001AB01839|nr:MULTISPECIES: SDR family NAD(P)-dependent oxidoreductase [Rhizobium]
MARPVAFVTGASSGIGLATATILASSGYDLALFDLNDEPLENLARTLRQQGGQGSTCVRRLLLRSRYGPRHNGH